MGGGREAGRTLHEAHVEADPAHAIRRGWAMSGRGWRAWGRWWPWSKFGCTHSSHSTTVPVIWRKGRPAHENANVSVRARGEWREWAELEARRVVTDARLPALGGLEDEVVEGVADLCARRAGATWTTTRERGGGWWRGLGQKTVPRAARTGVLSDVRVRKVVCARARVSAQRSLARW